MARLQELPRPGTPLTVVGSEAEITAALQILQDAGRPAAPGTELDDLGVARLWSPNEFLAEVVENLIPGKALDLGCGGGRDAVFLASKGWLCTGMDWLQDALEMGRNLQTRYSPEAFPIRWECGDLSGLALTGQFDLISMFFFLDRDLVRQASRCLAPGGSLVIETFTEHHRQQKGKPRREHLVLKEGEICALLPELEVLSYEEGWHHDRHTARFWGRLA